MKKLTAFVIMMIMVGFSATGCGTNSEKQASSNHAETNYHAENVTEKVEDRVKKEEATDKKIDDGADILEDKEAAEHSGDAEKVLFRFFKAMTDQDIEGAREYVLYDDLDYPFSSLEDALEFYSENKPIEITKVE